MNDQELSELFARLERDAKWLDRVDYVLMPLGLVVIAFVGSALWQEPRLIWRLVDAALLILTIYTSARLVYLRVSKRWLRNHEHDYKVIAIYDHAEIDLDDPIRHTSFHVMGCERCRQTILFPLGNALMVTPRFAKAVRRELKKARWAVPPMW
jgi:hypothetical protein